ncbi:MAG: hypothetical protein HRT72_10750 [Flavobacteriales bacterium]|nr:hypothetical protein [Flavobacteriales bacterium]
MGFIKASKKTYNDKKLAAKSVYRNGMLLMQYKDAKKLFTTIIRINPNIQKLYFKRQKENQLTLIKKNLGIKTSLLKPYEFRINIDSLSPNMSANLVYFKKNKISYSQYLNPFIPEFITA